MSGVSSGILLFLFLLSGGEPSACGGGTIRSFTFTIQEHRYEEVVTPGARETVPAEFQTESTVSGHFSMQESSPGTLFACIDSIMISNTQPFPFETFMSLDTLYYRAENKPNIIGKRIDAITDSMLHCVFDGPSLKISTNSPASGRPGGETAAGPPLPRTVTHQKPDCGSGEYSRLNLPVSLGFFFTALPGETAGRGFAWNERKALPSYSGLQYHPDLGISLRIVERRENSVTIVLNTDTTVTNQRLTMPRGETIDLLQDRIHLGGTVIVDADSGIVITGELRIEEEISYLRARLSTVPASKRCSYLLRLKTR